jgi:YfiH family protein
MKYITYPLPLFAVTTQGHDFKESGSLEKAAQIFDIPQPIYCLNRHGDQVIRVESLSDPIQEGDALVTTKKNIPLMICHADCQVGIFFDQKKSVLGVAHSGWRGSNLNIYGKVVEVMRELGCQEIQVAISPSLGPDKSEFLHYEKELHPRLWKYQFKPYYFDFWQISLDQLKEAGVQDVYLARICTYSSPEYFSYRRDKTPKRDATLAMILD